MRIFLDDDGAEYSRFVPTDWSLLGAVETEDGLRGALLRTSANVFVQMNGMLIRSLDQSRVSEIMAKASQRRPDKPGGAPGARNRPGAAAAAR